MQKVRFICNSCGSIFPKWMGQCDVCKEWNSVVAEELLPNHREKQPIPENFFVSVNDSTTQYIAKRYQTGLNELNRVLGGGLVDGSVILLSGTPGVGKSTLLLQILKDLSNDCIYISAEESVGQVLIRAQRLQINNSKLKIASSSNITQIMDALSNVAEHSIIIIDSIQTVYSELIPSAPGSISQVKQCTTELVSFAKSHNIILIIVGHVTKDGTIAGPKTLEHMVDVVLSFDGDKSTGYRILRGDKNRFGAIDEIGVFSMSNNGLQEVSNPSAAFLSDRSESVSGVSVFAGIEGTRTILSEIQSLVSVTSLPIPRRAAVGFDINRLSMIIAVLSTRCKIQFSNKDVFINIAGGLKINEPAADLAVAMAILSSIFKVPIANNTVIFGEIGLSGDIRPVNLEFTRLKEALKLGFNSAYCSNKTLDCPENVNLKKIKSIKQVMSIFK